jgi:hypothetical protein
MSRPPRRAIPPTVRVLALPGEDTTVLLLRFAASAVTLAVAVALSLAG